VSARAARIVQAIGAALLVLGAAWFHAVQVAEPAYSPTGTSRFGWTLVFVGVLTVCAYGMGLPELPRSQRGAAVAAVAAVGMTEVVISVLQLALGQALLPRFVLLGSAGLLVPWYVVCAGFCRDGIDRAAQRDRVVVVGDWADAADLSAELERGAERPAQIIDVLTPAQAAATRRGELPLRDAVAAAQATVVVLDRAAQLDRSIVEQAAFLHERGVRIRTLSLFYEEWLGKLPLSELERVSLMFDIGEIHRLRYGRFKRVVDVALACVGAVVLAVVVPIVVIGNLLGNRGALFFRQRRVGKGGAEITILKFRSMRTPDKEHGDGGSEWTGERDPRVTPFGGFLRRSHLDELPQVLNVLRGDLSIVGPRPEQPHYVDELTEKLPYYRLRHLVRPGLTGWAQVKYGYAASAADATEKLQYEFYYLRHQRLGLDLRIVARTIRSVLGREGR
jgi:lipopolysaccharide/colanic/teichoic acid biosynthesis glycosyltransferase